MMRSPHPILGSSLLMLALLAAPVTATLAVAEAPAPRDVADCCGGCCGTTPDATPDADCCSDDLPGCPLPCCTGLTGTTARPTALQDPDEDTPATVLVAPDRVPFVSPRAIDRPPRH